MTHHINHITNRALCGVEDPEPETIENEPDCERCKALILEDPELLDDRCDALLL